MEAISPQQELFCRFYAQNDDLFSNATLSYGEAYDYKLHELSTERPVISTNDEGKPIEFGESEHAKAYNTCAANASRLLRNDKIQARIIVLMNEWLKDDVVDSELFKVIKNHKMEAKIAGIREYNKMRGRIIEKTDITSGNKPLAPILVQFVNETKDNPNT